MSNLDQDADRAAKAQSILRNPLIKETFDSLEALYKDLWRLSDPENSEDREHYYRCLLALDSFKGHFMSLVQTGDFAEIEREAKFKIVK